MACRPRLELVAVMQANGDESPWGHPAVTKTGLLLEDDPEGYGICVELAW